MSGGYFDYQQYQIFNIAEEIESFVRANKKSKEENELDGNNRHHFSPEVILKFTEAVKILKTAYVYAQRIDWLVSDDDGEDSFLEWLDEELGKID